MRSGAARVLFLNNQGLGSMGGGVTILRHLVRDLGRDHAVTVASFDDASGADGVREIVLARPRPGRVWRLGPLHRARTLARSLPPSLVQDADTVVALDCHFAAALARRRPRRLVYLSLSCIARQEWAASPGAQGLLDAAQYAWLEHRIAQAADALVVASPLHEAGLRRWARVTRPATVLAPIFPSFAPPPSPGPPRPVTILAAGRLEPGKNMAAVIDLARRLRDQPCRWVIAGDGPQLAALRAQAEGLPVAFAGRVPDLAPLLAEADVFVHPSRYESFGIVVMEAMRAGLPVLCGAAAGCADLVRAAQAGHVADFSRPDAVAALLRLLIADAGLRARLGEAGQIAVARALGTPYVDGFRAVLAALDHGGG